MKRRKDDERIVYQSLAMITQFSLNMIVPIAMMCAVGIWLDSMLLTAAFFLLSMLFRKALGMGDVKLMGILALFLGAGEACRCFYRGLLTAAAMSLTLLAGKRIRIEEGIAFAPFLLAGYLLGGFL